MEYYLPTAIKLLEAYEELDAQPVAGENILSSKAEIEATLDTLNVAFEKYWTVCSRIRPGMCPQISLY